MQENDMVTFAAEADDLGKRIDVFAAENYEELSRSGIKKIIDSGNVLVNGKAVKANYKLRNGDVVTLIVPQIEPLEILPQNIPLDILYEDDDVIVINKPQGMVVHPAPGQIQRGVEIATSIVNSRQCIVNDQIGNSVAVRMAMLYILSQIGGGLREAFD
mgnify:CR=1 FL=1